MIVIMFIILGILAIIPEILIYRTLLKSRSKRAKRLYIAQAITVNLLMIIFMLFYAVMIVNPTFMGVVTWVILLFFISFFSKFALLFFLVVRWFIRLFSKRRELKSLIYVGYCAAVLVVCVMLYGATFGRTSLDVRYVEIQSDRLPQSFDGFRIAQFSDVHIGNYGGWTGLIEKLVTTINEIKPDIVVQSGDLVNIHSEELSDEFIRLFSQIEPQLYSVLGNHDLAYYIADTLKINPSRSVASLVQKQQSMGWSVLQNRGEWLYRGVDSILIGGVTFANNHHHNGYNSNAGGSNMGEALREANDGQYTILVAHSPNQFDSVSLYVPQSDLTLSGHTHTMQFKLSVGSWQWSPAQWAYERYSGLYEKQGRHLYINDGLGYVVFPLRIGTRPELTILTLRKK